MTRYHLAHKCWRCMDVLLPNELSEDYASTQSVQLAVLVPLNPSESDITK